MIFFWHPRVNFALFFVAIRDNLGQENRGIKAFKLNISQEIFEFFRVILTSIRELDFFYRLWMTQGYQLDRSLSGRHL